MSALELIEAVAKKTGEPQKWKLIPDSGHELPMRSATYPVSAAFLMNRSSHRRHASRSACECSLFAIAVTAIESIQLSRLR